MVREENDKKTATLKKQLGQGEREKKIGKSIMGRKD